MARIALTVNRQVQARLDAALSRLARDSSEVERPLLQFDRYWKAVTALEVGKVKATGGSYRGVSWPGMKPQYRRKTDGVVVPAWGGVPRVRRPVVSQRIRWKNGKPLAGAKTFGGPRTVQAKLRPSGQRVRQTSMMNADTRTLYNSLYASAPRFRGRYTVEIGGDLPIYAETILRKYGRNPVRFFPDDVRMFDSICSDWVDGLVARFNSGGAK